MPEAHAMRKHFVLDTNVLLHNPLAIESFADNVVVLPMEVIEELDKFKKENNELGRNARHVIRRLDALRIKGKLKEGVPMANGGILQIVPDAPVSRTEPLDQSLVDNRIIRVAHDLLKRGERVIFVSKDINARLKADVLGIEVMDFEKQKINFDELYTGCQTLKVAPAVMDEFREKHTVTIADLHAFPNEFVLLTDDDKERPKILTRARNGNRLVELSPDSEQVWKVKPRSKEQRIAIELLMDDTVQLVTLIGQAGTGKTLLALAAALQKTVIEKKYERILVSRPIMPLGKDIGYLPGDKEQKIKTWMEPIFDNLSYLMFNYDGAGHKYTVRDRIERLLKEEVVELEALTYIRGRSIPRHYVIIDEAQNLTPHEVKTIISRAGEGTKMVLTGDPYQIDNPYLDSSSNGLTYAVERLKEQPLHGHVTLFKSERSKLSAIAADLL